METLNSAVQDGKQVGMIAMSLVQKGRKYADKLPGRGIARWRSPRPPSHQRSGQRSERNQDGEYVHRHR
jgi:hypothetical protein